VPIYEFRCPDGHLFEVFQRMDDPPPEVCEICGKGPLAKVLHPVPVHFKGSGFYSTDYGRGGRKKEAGDGGEKKPADESVKKVEKEKTTEKKEPASSS
jgi:putative FmdB family regulatory protein